MDALPLWMIVVHILTVLWLVAGMVGRDVCHAQAAKAADLATLRAQTELGSVVLVWLMVTKPF